MSVDKQEKESILDELLVTIRAKRFELQDWNAKITKSTNEYNALIQQVRDVRKELQRLSEEQIALQKKIKDDQVFAKDQLKKIAEARQKLSLEIQAHEASQTKFSKEAVEVIEQSAQNKKKEIELKTREQKLISNQANLNKQESTFKREQDKLAEDKKAFGKEKEKYTDKLKFQDAEQNKVIANLEKSEELKKILENKIQESEALNIRLQDSLKENERASKVLEQEKKDNADIRQKITATESEQKARGKQQDNRNKELDEKNTQSELKRLRIEKLARDKGVQEELKALEKELKG